MGRSVARVAVIVAIAVLVWIAWTACSVDEPPPVSDPADEPAAHVPGDATARPATEHRERARPRASPDAADPPAPDAAPGATAATKEDVDEHVVHVERPDGSPAAGAVVLLESSGGAQEGSQPLRRREADAQGAARFPADAPHALYGGSWRVEAVWQDREAAIEEAVLGEMRIRLRPAVVLRGRVEDENGSPIAGARCVLTWPATAREDFTTFERTTAADAQGTFSFPPLPRLEGEQYGGLRVAATGRVAEARHFDAASQPEESLVFRLREAFVVRGRCVDESGRPVAGVRVRHRNPSDVQTDAEGRFAFDDMAPGSDVLVNAPGLVPVVLRLTTERGPLDLGDIVLRRGMPLRGVFVDEDGEPIASALVEVSPSIHVPWSRSATTGANGRFEILGLPDEPLHVRASTHEALGKTREAAASDVRPGADEIRLALPSGLRIRFRFVRADNGTSVAAAKAGVRLSSPTVPVKVPGRSWSTTPASLREVVYAVDGPGTYVADVSVLGFEPVHLDGIEVLADREAVVDVALHEKRAE